jgi:hypothetical protein
MAKRPSDLFNEPPVPAEPMVQPVKTASSPLVSLLIVVLAGILIYAATTRFDWGGGKGDRDEQHHEQKDDDKKQDGQKITAKPGWLHVVRERQDPPVDQQEAVAKIYDFCELQSKQDVKLGFRDTDEEDDTPAVRKMVDHAKSKGVNPPFLLYKTDGNELRGVIKLPATGSDSEILEVFK